MYERCLVLMRFSFPTLENPSSAQTKEVSAAADLLSNEPLTMEQNCDMMMDRLDVIFFSLYFYSFSLTTFELYLTYCVSPMKVNIFLHLQVFCFE